MKREGHDKTNLPCSLSLRSYSLNDFGSLVSSKQVGDLQSGKAMISALEISFFVKQYG